MDKVLLLASSPCSFKIVSSFILKQYMAHKRTRKDILKSTYLDKEYVRDNPL